jgi:hypothetical protein
MVIVATYRDPLTCSCLTDYDRLSFRCWQLEFISDPDTVKVMANCSQ